ncbi:cytochrome P450 [soil metagenome]|nr:cytochrome P450 [Acidobacteriota bacterium]
MEGRPTAASYPSGSSTTEAPLDFLRRLAADGGDIIPFRLGRRPAFLLNHPAHIDDVLVKQAETFVKGRAFDRARDLLGNGPLTASGAQHVERRRIAQGAFHRQRLPAYSAVMHAHAARLRNRWDGAPVDVARDMRELTLGIAGEVLFGADLAGAASEVGNAVEMAASARDGLISIVAPRRQTRVARRRLDPIIDAVLERRRARHATSPDLLSLLLDAVDGGDPGSEQQLRDDVLTFLLAAHDTIAHALTWTWLLLAEHPEADRTFAAELEEVTGSASPWFEDLTRLPYTRAVLAEALRLFPPAWVIVRQATRLQTCGGVLIPPGALVVASPFVIHRDERFFPDPLRFLPERWLRDPEAPPAGQRNPAARCTYFPFGAGPRSCIGEGFAWMEGVLVLATLGQAWRLNRSPGGGSVALPRITLRPKGPVLMTPVRRDGGNRPAD